MAVVRDHHTKRTHSLSTTSSSRTSILLLSLLCTVSLYLAFSLFKSPSLAATSQSLSQNQQPCDYSNGKWIYDLTVRSPSRYDNTCKEIYKGWNCIGSNKSNAIEIVKWRWKPNQCDLPPFDPVAFLKLYRNTNIGFVGDSLNRNMFVSLFCTLKRVSGEVRKWRPVGADRGFTFLQYNLTIAYHRTNLLARYGSWSASDKNGKLESLGYKEGYRVDVDIPDGTWAEAPTFHDILILNTGHWFSGKLVLDKTKTSKSNDDNTSTDTTNQEIVDAKLTSKALVWGSQLLLLADVVSVSYTFGVRHFTVHSYPVKRTSLAFACFKKSGRSRKDFRFLAATIEEAVQWVSGFADQQCFVNCARHPLVSSKKQASDFLFSDFPLEPYIKCKSPPTMLVILNPRSGHGRSSKVFHGTVEPIFKLAGFNLEVVKTTAAGHARNLAASIDFSTCPDGIICVGGDGIVNEVLNGLLSRDNQKEAISIPIGIIPAGSDNSLVWTVLGVRDPVSAAIAIVKGGLTATDVFAVEWVHTGAIHFGTTVAYFGFISDVLELSEKYQKRFGPLRYFVAGVLKFLCLPKYGFEVEYLPASKERTDRDAEVVDMSELYTDIMRKSNKDGIPRASSLSSIDSIMTPNQISSADLDTTCSSTEPSDYVRGIDPKSKRLSSGRSNVTAEPEVSHPHLPLSSTPNWPRTRSKSRTDKGWTGLTATHDTARSTWGTTAANDKEDISSTMSDPGPVWDAEPKWDSEPHWNMENPVELPGPAEDDDNDEDEINKDDVPRSVNEWITTKGQFLGVLVCNHSCKTVQSLSSQVVAPKAEHDDNTLDLLLVHGSGRLKLLRFFFLLQFGRHLSLPYVEYVKVKSVKLKQGKTMQNGCGIDGELFPVAGQVITSLFPEQCRLIGHSAGTGCK